VLVRDTMTPNPITIGPQETMHGAMALMSLKRIRHLPVVDAKGTLIGMVTDRDLRRAAPSPLFPGAADAEAQMEQVSVERVMIRAPATVGPAQKLEDAVKLFVEKKFGALPVLDGARLVGIVTPIDVMRRWLQSPALRP